MPITQVGGGWAENLVTTNNKTKSVCFLLYNSETKYSSHGKDYSYIASTHTLSPYHHHPLAHLGRPSLMMLSLGNTGFKHPTLAMSHLSNPPPLEPQL